MHVGDKVIAIDSRTSEVHTEIVTDVFQHTASSILWISVTQDKTLTPTMAMASSKLVANRTTELLGVTAGHPFFVVGKGWKEAQQLIPGDVVEGFGASQLIVLTKIIDESPQMVFNMTVQSDATYFVGNLRVLVHNGRKPHPPAPPLPDVPYPHSRQKPDGTGWITWDFPPGSDTLVCKVRSLRSCALR